MKSFLVKMQTEAYYILLKLFAKASKVQPIKSCKQK